METVRYQLTRCKASKTRNVGRVHNPRAGGKRGGQIAPGGPGIASTHIFLFTSCNWYNNLLINSAML